MELVWLAVIALIGVGMMKMVASALRPWPSPSERAKQGSGGVPLPAAPGRAPIRQAPHTSVGAESRTAWDEDDFRPSGSHERFVAHIGSKRAVFLVESSTPSGLVRITEELTGNAVVFRPLIVNKELRGELLAACCISDMAARALCLSADSANTARVRNLLRGTGITPNEFVAWAPLMVDEVRQREEAERQE